MSYKEISFGGEREAERRAESGSRLEVIDRLENAEELGAKPYHPTGPGGTEVVDVSQIEDPSFNSPEDSRSDSYNSLKREMQMHEQMRPYIEQGHGLDTFDQWDKHYKIGAYSEQGHVRGYNDTYHAYYGDGAMALSQRPDGKYDIINGRHRIALARELGIKQIPARVQR